MQRFFLDNLNLWDKEIVLYDEEIIHQLVKVLRSKVWDELIFFDSNFDYKYKINSINKKSIVFNFILKIKKENTNKDIKLYQRIPNKISKIEFIIQKWVEVWINEFIFFMSDRSQKLIISPNKIERFKKIIKEAVEQSWQNYIPKINFVDKVNFENLSWINLFFHTDNKDFQKLDKINFKNIDKINLFVWPEWWFTDEESNIFLKNKFIKINLWPSILRTETVWIVVSFFINQKL